MDAETLDERLRAVERALTDDDRSVAQLQDGAALAARLDELAARLDELESDAADREAAVQALRGYVGNVRSVNRDVERRADAALSEAASAPDRHGRDGGDDARSTAGCAEDNDDPRPAGSASDGRTDHRTASEGRATTPGVGRRDGRTDERRTADAEAGDPPCPGRCVRDQENGDRGRVRTAPGREGVRHPVPAVEDDRERGLLGRVADWL